MRHDDGTIERSSARTTQNKTSEEGAVALLAMPLPAEAGTACRTVAIWHNVGAFRYKKNWWSNSYQSCTSMQSLRRSAARAFGSVAHGHGAHDIKNPTTDIVISLVLGECPLYAGLAISAIASRLLVFPIFIYALLCFFSFPLPCHAFVPLCIPHIVVVVVFFLR